MKSLSSFIRVLIEAAAPGQLTAQTQVQDFVTADGIPGIESKGSMALQIIMPITDAPGVSKLLHNVGIPFKSTEDGNTNVYFNFDNKQQLTAAEEVIKLSKKQRIKNLKKADTLPVGVSGPKNEIGIAIKHF